MLPTFQSAVDLVVRCLLVPVGDYLDQGSPLVDYTQSATSFIKTYLGDVDVGTMFNNFVDHFSKRYSLGIRYIHRNPRLTVEPEELLRFCVLKFGNKSHLILPVRDILAFLKPLLRVNIVNYVEQKISALRSLLRICQTLWQRSEQRRACFGRLLFVGRVMSTSHGVRRTPNFLVSMGPTNISINQKRVNLINLCI